MDFWQEFDALIDEFNDDQKREISNSLIEAKRCVTGLTDSGVEFISAFEKIISEYRHVMSDEQCKSTMCLSDKLISHFRL